MAMILQPGPSSSEQPAKPQVSLPMLLPWLGWRGEVRIEWGKAYWSERAVTDCEHMFACSGDGGEVSWVSVVARWLHVSSTKPVHLYTLFVVRQHATTQTNTRHNSVEPISRNYLASIFIFEFCHGIFPGAWNINSRTCV